ncbi:MAG: hypothetical protein GY754_03825 [bacterium]|nr:hypothetical protein [bacterium]
MKKILKKQTFRVKDILPHTRADLENELAAIVESTFNGLTRAFIVENLIFRSPHTLLTIFYGPRYEIAGFTSFGIKRYEAGREKHDVIDSGVYLKNGYRGLGGKVVWITMQEVLRYKLRNLRVPLVFVGIATSPVAFRSIARQLFLYPAPDFIRSTPKKMTNLVRKVVKDRNLLIVDNDPWRVRPDFKVGLQDEARLKRYLGKNQDQYLDFYCERNPGYMEGDFLVIAVPLNAKDLIANITRKFRKRPSKALELMPREKSVYNS